MEQRIIPIDMRGERGYVLIPPTRPIAIPRVMDEEMYTVYARAARARELENQRRRLVPWYRSQLMNQILAMFVGALFVVAVFLLALIVGVFDVRTQPLERTPTPPPLPSPSITKVK